MFDGKIRHWLTYDTESLCNRNLPILTNKEDAVIMKPGFWQMFVYEMVSAKLHVQSPGSRSTLVLESGEISRDFSLIGCGVKCSSTSIPIPIRPRKNANSRRSK